MTMDTVARLPFDAAATWNGVHDSNVGFLGPQLTLFLLSACITCTRMLTRLAGPGHARLGQARPAWANLGAGRPKSVIFNAQRRVAEVAGRVGPDRLFAPTKQRGASRPLVST